MNKLASVNARIDSNLKAIITSRCSQAGITESDILRGALLYAASLPDEQFEVFAGRYIIKPEVDLLGKHFRQEKMIMDTYVKALEGVKALATGAYILDKDESFEQVATFFHNVARDIRNQRFNNKCGMKFSSRFTSGSPTGLTISNEDEDGHGSR